VGADPAGTAAALVAALAPVAASGAYADLQGVPELPAGGISEARAVGWDAAAAGERPLIDLGEITDLVWADHGAVGEARLVASGTLYVTPPASGAWWSTIRVTSATGAEELSIDGAGIGVRAGSAPIAPALGQAVEVVILATPTWAIVSAVVVE
jgi:hypothetical protein